MAYGNNDCGFFMPNGQRYSDMMIIEVDKTGTDGISVVWSYPAMGGQAITGTWTLKFKPAAGSVVTCAFTVS